MLSRGIWELWRGFMGSRVVMSLVSNGSERREEGYDQGVAMDKKLPTCIDLGGKYTIKKSLLVYRS